MDDATIKLNVPAAVYERAQQIAAASDRTVESVLLDGLTLLFGPAPALDITPDELDACSDEQLWAVVVQRLLWPQDARLRELLALGERGALLNGEHAELERLLDIADQHMLLRSHALALLKARGHAVEGLLQPTL